MAQLVKCLTLAQVMLTLSVSSSPVVGSVLTAQSLEPASDSVSLSLPLPRSHSVSLSLSLKNKHLKTNMWYIDTMKYYSSIKKNEILPFATNWMELDCIISEIIKKK